MDPTGSKPILNVADVVGRREESRRRTMEALLAPNPSGTPHQPILSPFSKITFQIAHKPKEPSEEQAGPATDALPSLEQHPVAERSYDIDISGCDEPAMTKKIIEAFRALTLGPGEKVTFNLVNITRVPKDEDNVFKEQRLLNICKFWLTYFQASEIEQDDDFDLCEYFTEDVTGEDLSYFVPPECGNKETFHIIGDIHGDLNTILFSLIHEYIDILPGTINFDTRNGEIVPEPNEFTIKLPNIKLKSILPKEFIMYMGDLIDRGIWSSEVLAILIHLLKASKNIGLSDLFKICAGNHEEYLLINRPMGDLGKFSSNLKNLLKELISTDLIKCAYAVNGVMFAHSYLTEETLQLILENLDQGSKEYMAAKYFLENKDNAELFRDSHYNENLNILVSVINRLFKIYILQDGTPESSKAKLIFNRQNTEPSLPDGLLWQRFTKHSGKPPLKCIQFAYAHHCNRRRKAIKKQAVNAFDFDGAASYAMYPQSANYSNPQRVTFFPDGCLRIQAFANPADLFPRGGAIIPKGLLSV